MGWERQERDGTTRGAGSLPAATRALQRTTEEQRPATGGVSGHGFRPSRSGNPTGRPRGTPNKATQEVRALARRLVDDPQYQASVQRRLRDGEAGALELLLWHYAYGKPK